MNRERRAAAQGMSDRWARADNQRGYARIAQAYDIPRRQLTGRQLVLLRKRSVGRVIRMLWNLAGVRTGIACDREQDPLPGISVGEGIVFPCVNAALMSVDEDQMAALRTGKGTDLVSIEPERVIDVMQGVTAETSGVAAQCPCTGDPGPFCESAETWGLQATRVSLSRFTGRGVRVAILDSGLDFQHPDFAKRAIVSASFVPDNSVNDTNGHGTYCAGLVCGPISPALGPRYGVANGADLYVGKIVGETGSGADGNILSGIDWAIRRGCAVISLSVGTAVVPGEPYSTIFEQVAARALAVGTLIVGAAGNTSLRPDRIAPVDHPANCPSIMAVSAVDSQLRIAPFSCGGVDREGPAVDLAAPGVALRSAWSRPELYRSNSGTSMASPYVAGIAALLLEEDPTLRGRELRDRLRRAARPLSLPARDVGAGLVQAP